MLQGRLTMLKHELKSRIRTLELKHHLLMFSKKSTLTGHIWEDCSRRVGLRQRKLRRQTIAEFSTLPV